MPEPESEIRASTCPLTSCGNAQAAASGHGLPWRLKQEIEKDLLELSGIAMDGGAVRRIGSSSTSILRSLELMLEPTKECRG